MTKPPQPRPAIRRRSRLVDSFGVVLAVSVVLSLAQVYTTSLRASQTYTVCSSSKHIYTVDESNPNVECIAVSGSRILNTGSLGDTKTASGTWRYFLQTITGLGGHNVFHLKPGAIVVPGLADAHAHILDYGFKLQLPLDGSKSIDDIVQRIKQFITSHPDVKNDTSCWIEGMGWDQTIWDSPEFPTAADLDHDPLLRGRPIALSRVDGHASWVSPRTLELMGTLPESVSGGTILRDAHGNATGIFIDNAMDLVPHPPWSEKQTETYFHATMKDALAHGLTSIHDAAASPRMIKFFKRTAEEGKLPIRLYLMGCVLSDTYTDWIGKIPRLEDHGTHSRLNVRSVKLFADGALGSWGAALLEPYSDNAATCGIMRNTPEKLAMLVKALWHDGWQVNIHCIGDRANKVVLDIFEDMIEGENGTVNQNANVTLWRPRIEHAQIMTAHDLGRLGRLGVIASVQPTHATSDMWYAESRLGSDRIKSAYTYQALLQASPEHVLPLGSDFPVEGINPLLGFYAAVSRLSITGTSPQGPGGWFPAERLTRAQALKGMTLDAAYASFAESEIGSLVVGKKADFVVLDRDILSVPVGEILETKVLATVIDGKVAYGAL